MKTKLLALFVLLSGIINAQTPNWVWARAAGGTSEEMGNGVAVDINGNVYVTGAFKSPTVTFGSIVLTNTPSIWHDVFVVKYDHNGTVIWAKSGGGNSDDVGNSVAVDAIGNVYVTGFIGGTSTFGSYTLTSAGNADFFLVKYDPNGTVLWAKSAGGIDHDKGYGVALDGFGNIYVTGTYTATNITFGTTVLNQIGSIDIFVVKYDPNGNVIWAKSGGGNSVDESTSIAVDSIGNAFITGGYDSNTITFGTASLNNYGNLNPDCFLVKYNPTGNVLWARSFGGINNEAGEAIAIDHTGNVFINGYYDGDSVSIGNIVLYGDPNSVNGVFTVKYDSLGNILWARAALGAANEDPHGIAVDGIGNSFITGDFTNSFIVFGNDTVHAVGVADIYLAKYDPNGNTVWAKSQGGSEGDYTYSIASSYNGDIYITGKNDSPNLVFGSDTLVHSTGLNADFFVAKLSTPLTGIHPIDNEPNISIYPNPAQNNFRISLPQTSFDVTITDVFGREVYSGKQLSEKTEIDVSNLLNGIYIVRAVSGNNNYYSGKIMIMK